MAKKADNFFVRVSKYRKEHPRATQEQAIAKLRGTKVSGVKKKTATSGVKKVPRKKTVIKTERLTTIGSVAKKSTVKNAALTKGMAVIRKINSLEAKLKKTKGKDARDLIKTVINGEHDKLDIIKKQAKG